MVSNSLTKTKPSSIDNLYNQIASHINSARSNIVRTIDTEQVKAYWLIGRDIVIEEQKGKERAEYGKEILKGLSQKLSVEFGRGFSVDKLERTRKFYLMYQIEQKNEKSATLLRKSEVPEFKSNLGWSHYLLLMKVERFDARRFYEIESSLNNWSVRELKRQIGSLLFERLAKSKDKRGLMQLVHKGQEILKPEDAIKEPLIFEFLGWPESHKLVESELEEALISKLQKFLLELGKGFSFVARQKRLTLDGDHFYIDLVFYHTILKAYVLIDIKAHPVTHSDLGQIQLYRNYYDIECRGEGDNPTIGLILCTEKNKKMVRYFLGDGNKNIFANKYQLNLPTEEELEQELRKEIKDIKDKLNIS